MADPFEDVQAALQRAMAQRTGQDDQAAAMRQVGIMIGMAVRALTDKAQAGAPSSNWPQRNQSGARGRRHARTAGPAGSRA